MKKELKEKNKIYGLAVAINQKEFIGFCKRVHNTKKQSVDIFILDKKIDTIIANKPAIEEIENNYCDIFDIDGFCFFYTIPDKFIKQRDLISFKDENGQDLFLYLN